MKILVQDGGGVFGRIQARIMMEADCFEKFDAHVGTSIGATLAEAYALEVPSRVSPEFFDQWMYQIFKKEWLRSYNPLVSKYSDTGLNNALRSVFGSLRFGDAKKPLFITAADIGQKNLKVFSSLSSEDQRWPAWEIGRAATAAETYFMPWKGFADGGIFANNPSMVGLAAAVKVLGCRIEDVEILSIGTGQNSSDSGKPPRTRIGFGIWTVEAMLNGAASSMHEYFVSAMPVKKYTRIQFVKEPGWKMDDPKCMYYAERKWALDIQDAIKIVRDF